ncbi:MAG: 30S ribosomal protein S1 [Alphaproteobacteria bacterium]|jgi:small subunit ribosomal protein S1|nr:30S ribosomal protein S1 [Alphaproteobacteria bacterium]
MSTPNENTQNFASDMESFEKLLLESEVGSAQIVGTVVPGRVISIYNDMALIDVGLKSEGRVGLKELSRPGSDETPKVGDIIDVYVERMEDKDGLVVLSREKARREEAWGVLERSFNANETVMGTIFGRVKGGFTVDLAGAVAFLPRSQLDIRPIKDAGALMGIEQPFQILKMDRSRGNIVVSRRSILEESRQEARDEVLAKLSENQIIDGVVKNITDYGAFVDLGGLDGLLHVTDISWRRVGHPSEVLQVGQNVRVQVIRFNAETQRVSLGMKQLEEDPWKGVEERYPVGARLTGHVTNVTEYGAFVELDSGIEGLIHVSEMSWTKKSFHPNKILSPNQEVEVMVLEVDPSKRRIALGLKQCMENPWEKVAVDHPVGTDFEGEIRNITEFGLFVSVSEELDGMVHMSDLSWDVSPDEAIKTYKKGQRIRVKVLDVDPGKERIALGIKQLEKDPFQSGIEGINRGDIVTCEITEVVEAGLEVLVNGSVPGFIRKAELSKDRNEQRTDRFAVGEKVDARITAIDARSRRLTLSVRGREIQEEREAVEHYGSADSGASLGDILGAAFDRARDDK